MVLKKLPDAEFELMRIVWDNPSPISTNQIMDRLHGKAQWKPQTVLTLLMRLVDRGFLRSERMGRERIYYPLVTREAYLAYESRHFMERFRLQSARSLVSALYEGEALTDSDREDIRRWLDERGDGHDGA